MKKLRDFPSLPLLPMSKCMEVFAIAKIIPVQLARITGYSRMTVWHWRKGRNTTAAVHDDVSTLAYRVLRAIDSRFLPTTGKMTDEWLRSVLSDEPKCYRPLGQYTASQLLPMAWREELEVGDSVASTPAPDEARTEVRVEVQLNIALPDEAATEATPT